MEFPTYIKDSSIAHPNQQWNMHFNEYERMVLTNPIQNRGQGLHPRTGGPPIPNHIEDGGQAQEIHDGETKTFTRKGGGVNQITFARWGNVQQSIAIAIFSQKWGIFSRVPVNATVVDQLAREGVNPTLPFFECYIFEPTFENMPEQFVKCAMQVKKEINRLVRPALTRFINYRFKVKPFNITDTESDEEGPAIEGQWVPEAGGILVVICRELKPDGSYGKWRNLIGLMMPLSDATAAG
ncbi:uncharacterized protein TRUGW13939_07695 [Talaromyces rugulosus]|uniref:Uncharacterized protein n=1 Tax=Talaromyces rugulosus TaxID=121627 RepID=A0A7H8R2E7_TALRU|nr:uncharacterized protein TRUGW13939_07695 [Talaromyces rugulosus]QKX60550.1 hypothetical protein TRUGW13939_07695 [Talaromyces rugulosus]